VGFQRGLDACVILNAGTLDVSRLSMASTIEAITGAVELDGGSEAVMQLVTRLGLVHPMLTSVTSRFPFPLSETIYTSNVMTSSALPLAPLPSSTHGSFNQV
jgi:dsRNA-specific ribonuclease